MKESQLSCNRGSGNEAISYSHGVHTRMLLYGTTSQIADFGLSRDLQDEEYYISSGGKVPVKWTAPEALTFRTYSTASDVWSYGVLLYEIWALGTKPYHDSTNKEVWELTLQWNPPFWTPELRTHFAV